MKRNCFGKSIVVSLLFVLLVLASCGDRKPRPDADAGKAPQYLEHIVTYSGETLSLISQWYTGKVSNWSAIAQENPGLKPERIKIGQVILVPQALVVNSEKLPENFVKDYVARVSAIPAGEETAAEPVATPDGQAQAAEKIADEPASATAAPEAAAVSTETPAVGETAAPAAAEAPAAADGWEKAINKDQSAGGEKVDSSKADEEKERERLLDELLGE